MRLPKANRDYLLTLKRQGCWRSLTVAEGYIEESVSRRIEVSRKSFCHSRSVKTTPTSENKAVGEKQKLNTSTNILSLSTLSSTVIENEVVAKRLAFYNTNCTIDISIKKKIKYMFLFDNL